MNETTKAPAPVTPSKPYYAGIDIVKILAVFLVVCIHFYLYTGFYYTPINNSSFIVPIAGRWIAYTCVPIFMIATGYLMKNKTISKDYYKGLIKIIVIYVVISIICIKFNKERYGTEFDAWKIFKGFTEYSNANYAWYVNYYISIFLVIPFLNLAFNGLKTKKQRLVLVVTVTALTVFARSFFLGFERNEQAKLFPDYLSGVWPFANYYAGAFIREYPMKKKVRGKLITAVIMIADLIFLTLSTYHQSMDDIENDQHVLSWHFNDYSSYPVFILALCIFILLCDIKTENKTAKRILRTISGATFATYLISYVFDGYFYESHPGIFGFKDVVGFNAKYPDVPERFSHWHTEVLRHFIPSLICGIAIHGLYDLGETLVKKAFSRKAEPSAEAVVEAAAEAEKKAETAEENKE
ncbi:MAG: acyltransferase family protein [Ruminococcus sp.]|nr:acyltransferase family protein [Ruminococcus sp.]